MCTNPRTAWILDIKKYYDSYKYVFDKNYLSCRFVDLMLTSFYQRKVIWNISTIPRRYHFFLHDIEIPCGKCDECLLKHARMWQVRCSHEAMYHTQMCFLTLTYNTAHLPTNNGVPTVFYPDIQLFFKRLRSALHYQFKIGKLKKEPKIRYFLCTEYGGKTKRPHFHVILYGYCPKYAFAIQNYFRHGKSGMPVYRSPEFEQYWNRGFVFVGTVTECSCGYVARYTLDKQKHTHTKGFYKDRFKEKIGMSRRQMIGYKWIEKYYKQALLRGFLSLSDEPNLKFSIPRSYINYVQKIDSHFYHKEYLPIKIRKFYLFRDKLAEIYKSANDYIKKYKHNAQYNKERVKKLKRFDNSIDFSDFENKPLILNC